MDRTSQRKHGSLDEQTGDHIIELLSSLSPDRGGSLGVDTRASSAWPQMRRDGLTRTLSHFPRAFPNPSLTFRVLFPIPLSPQ